MKSFPWGLQECLSVSQTHEHEVKSIHEPREMGTALLKLMPEAFVKPRGHVSCLLR